MSILTIYIALVAMFGHAEPAQSSVDVWGLIVIFVMFIFMWQDM